jgi:hypothetical protein
MIKEKRIQFDVICNNEDSLQEHISWYNSTYRTNFKIVEYLLDEVNFAIIEASVFQIEDIFRLGYQFGRKEEKIEEVMLQNGKG